jgi:hypothetical protein
MAANPLTSVDDQGKRSTGAHPADRSERSASVERVSAALCSVTGLYAVTTDGTTRKLVAAVLREYQATVEQTEGVDFDAETGEFRSAAGDIRLAVDRFPVDSARWDALVGVAAAAGLVAAGASWGGVAGPNGAWVAAAALGLVAAGSAVRRTLRADVSVTSRRD